MSLSGKTAIYELEVTLQEKYKLKAQNGLNYKIRCTDSKNRTLCLNVSEEFYEGLKLKSTYRVLANKPKTQYDAFKFEEIEKAVQLKTETLLAEHFAESEQVRINVYVLFAHELKKENKFSTVKIVGVVNYNNGWSQMDLLLDTTEVGRFYIESRDENSLRVNKALKRVFDLKNTWCVADVRCVKSFNNNQEYYKLMLCGELDPLEDEDELNKLAVNMTDTRLPNASYLNKVFECFRITKLVEAKVQEYNRQNNKGKLIAYKIETAEKGIIEGATFVHNNMNDDTLQDLLGDIHNINLDIDYGCAVYAVVNKKLTEKNYQVASLICRSATEDYYSIFTK